MPLTFAHPAAVLPFSRKSRYIHFSAMVLGSMSPDFEYFLRGQPLGEILPLVAVVYLIYHIFIHQTLFNHLPLFLQDSYSKKTDTSSNTIKIIVFCYSALLGMLTHIIWDSFTHRNGYMVMKLPTLNHTFNLYGFDIPLYKFLQHGSTLFGITAIFIYMYCRALPQKNQITVEVKPKQKIIFWSSLFLLTTLIVVLWYLIDYVSIMSYGIVVVRIIDSALLSFLILSVLYRTFGPVIASSVSVSNRNVRNRHK